MSDLIRKYKAQGMTLDPSQWGPSSLPHKDPMQPVMDQYRGIQRRLNEQRMMDEFVPQNPDVFPPPPAGSDKMRERLNWT